METAVKTARRASEVTREARRANRREDEHADAGASGFSGAARPRRAAGEAGRAGRLRVRRAYALATRSRSLLLLVPLIRCRLAGLSRVTASSCYSLRRTFNPKVAGSNPARPILRRMAERKSLEQRDHGWRRRREGVGHATPVHTSNSARMGQRRPVAVPGGNVHLNSATLEQLNELPGVRPVTTEPR